MCFLSLWWEQQSIRTADKKKRTLLKIMAAFIVTAVKFSAWTSIEKAAHLAWNPICLTRAAVEPQRCESQAQLHWWNQSQSEPLLQSQARSQSQVHMHRDFEINLVLWKLNIPNPRHKPSHSLKYCSKCNQLLHRWVDVHIIGFILLAFQSSLLF